LDQAVARFPEKFRPTCWECEPILSGRPSLLDSFGSQSPVDRKQACALADDTLRAMQALPAAFSDDTRIPVIAMRDRRILSVNSASDAVCFFSITTQRFENAFGPYILYAGDDGRIGMAARRAISCHSGCAFFFVQ
jgi:hypothetical protein